MVERPCLFLYRRPKKRLTKNCSKFFLKIKDIYLFSGITKDVLPVAITFIVPKQLKRPKKKKPPKNPSEQKQQTNKKPHDCLERGVETFDIHHLKSSS